MSSSNVTWTVMVYLAGDNNLTEEMVWALKEMKGLTHGVPNLNVVAQFDSNGIGVPTRRYDLSKQPSTESLEVFEEPVIALSTSNTGNPEALSSFLEWGATKHPADKYAVILSGHGSGSVEDFLLKDDNPVDSLSIDELKQALSSFKNVIDQKIDILGMDCCLMSMVEVCAAVSPYANIAIGAEGFEPESGWPYHLFIKEILENPALLQNETDLAKMVVKEYVCYYVDFDRAARLSVDQAAVNLGAIGTLVEKLGALADVLKNQLPAAQDQVVLAHWEAQTYKFDQYTDIKDFCTILKGRCLGIQSIATACDHVISAVENCVIISCCSGPAFQYSYGLSVYFPWAEVSDEFLNVDPTAEIQGGDQPVKKQWHDFITACVYQTRRKPSRYGEAADSTYYDSLLDQRLRWGAARNVFKEKAMKTGQPIPPKFGYFSGGYVTADGQHRYDKSRYDKSRYDKSRFGISPDRWIKNPPLASGKICRQDAGDEDPDCT